MVLWLMMSIVIVQIQAALVTSRVCVYMCVRLCQEFPVLSSIFKVLLLGDAGAVL